jgi:4-amino-4-deoxy-L-arabinose transferase-like glycosyltransferase
LNTQQKLKRRGSTPALLAGIAVLVCLFGQLGAMGLTGPDEPRYVWIARVMAQTGDWVTPRLYGQPWFEKPILYYWLAAIGFRLHFSAEWAARLPSAFAALALLAAIAWLARRLYGQSPDSARDPAMVTTLIFTTTVAATGFARAATPDMLFSTAIGAAMVCASVLFEQEGALRAASESIDAALNRSLFLVLFGAFLGLGVLAKGPAAVILAAGALLLWALATGQWKKTLGLAHPFAIGAFGIVALPWYLLCALRNPDFLHVFIFQHNFERYLTPVFQHRQPFWFFGPITLAAMLPWTALLWPAAQNGLRLWRDKSWHASPAFFFSCWAIFPVLFFSFSQSKLPSYILPAVAPLALVCAVAWIRTVERGPRALALIGALLTVTWVALVLAGLLFVRRIPWGDARLGDRTASVPVFLYVVFALILLSAALAFWSARSSNAPRVIGLCAFCFVLGVQAADLAILPQLDRQISARYYANFLRNYAHPDRLFIYQLPRAWDYGLAFYFGRELPEWPPHDPDPALVLTTPKGSAAIVATERSVQMADAPPARDALVLVPITAARHFSK